jgi:cytochrome P450
MTLGADTLVAGLAYTIYELADVSNKSYLYNLVSDLDRVEFTEDGLPVSFAAIDKLERLENVIREGLRLHTPSGHIQTRVVPKGGETVAGYYLPEGVCFQFLKIKFMSLIRL